jgi:subtilisin family serine protease
VTRPMTTRRRRLATFAVASTTLATAFTTIGGATTPLYAATSHASSTHLSKAAAGAKKTKVIVLLRNQHGGVPASAGHLSKRLALIKADQSGLLAELRKAGVTGLHSFTTLNGFSATLTAAQAAVLSADSRVASVVADTVRDSVPVASDGATTTSVKQRSQAQPNTIPPAGTQTSALCGTAANPKIEPEALSTTRDLTTDGSPYAQQLATGNGVTVAFIADGVDPANPDFQRGGHSIVSYVDLTGTPGAPTPGAEGFGDASAIAAQGNAVYDISVYNNPVVGPVPAGCDIKIVGMAPGANLIDINSTLYTSNIVEGIDYAVTHGANVLNESFGGPPTPDSGTPDAIRMANDAAVAAGLVVTASSGDAGTTGTVGSPATDSDPGVLSVGASTDSRLYQQTGYAATSFSNGKWTDNNISSLSSGGVTDGGDVPDLVAPGEADWALCSTDTTAYFECGSLYGGTDNGIQPFGGTSQSAPMTAGAAALVIQAYRDAHHGNSPSPALVKQILVSTTRDLGVPAFEQGAGLLDARAAVEAARSVAGPGGGSSPSIGQNLLVGPTQLDLTAKPGTTKWVPVSVTNVGTTGQTVIAGSRVLAPQSEQTQTVQLNSAGDAADTPFLYVTGAHWVAHKVTFTVPAGADRLALRGAWQGAAKTVGTATVTPVVRFTILDPSGTYVANSRPQGGPVSANYANLDIRQPVAGQWTAILYTLQGASGYTGPVILDTTTQVSVPGDTVTPSTSWIPAGATRTVWARIAVPNAGGDTTENITISGSGGTTTSVPVVLRTLVELDHRHGSFTGTITGGNARAEAPTETGAWAFDVPWGAPTVSVGLTLADDPNVVVEGVLVSPAGEAVDIATNQQTASDGSTVTTNTLQLTEANPTPGRYRFILVVENPVSGAEISQDFTGTVSLAPVPVSANGLPTSRFSTIKRNHTKTVNVRVTNPGVAPISVQVDPRSTRSGAVALTPLGDATTSLPNGFTPPYLVPPGTSSLTVGAVSEPGNSQLEIEGPLLAPDILGSVNGSTSVASDSAPQVGRGVWYTQVTEVLPPGSATVDGTTTATAVAQTQLFDTDVTSDTGDPWLQSVQATPTGTNTDGGVGIVIQPGQTRTITVTITPTISKGTTVSGVLNIVTFGFGGPYVGVIPEVTSSVLASLPYKYTVS